MLLVWDGQGQKPLLVYSEYAPAPQGERWLLKGGNALVLECQSVPSVAIYAAPAPPDTDLVPTTSGLEYYCQHSVEPNCVIGNRERDNFKYI